MGLKSVWFPAEALMEEHVRPEYSELLSAPLREEPLAWRGLVVFCSGVLGVREDLSVMHCRSCAASMLPMSNTFGVCWEIL